jgi:hypothetical protein
MEEEWRVLKSRSREKTTGVEDTENMDVLGCNVDDLENNQSVIIHG